MQWAEVASQVEDPASMLSLYRRLIALRRRSPALVTGEYRTVDVRGPVLAYLRCQGDEAFLVALNLSDLPRRFELPPGIGHGQVEISTRDASDRRSTASGIELGADEGLIIRLERPPAARTSTMG
jgi:hypothetical protein